MTIEEKLASQFEKFGLGPVRQTSNTEHLYTDYAELVSLFSNEDGIPFADILDRFKDENIKIASTEAAAEEDNDHELTDIIASNTGEQLDGEEQWEHTLLLSVQQRHSLFGDDYPFEAEDSTLKLKDAISEKQKIYIMLLICSNLNYFSTLQPTLTTEFEVVSSNVVGQLLPEGAIVRKFGKRSDYEGTAQEKIRRLAADMNLSVDRDELERVVGNQERGLDLVAWLPFLDRVPNFITILAQCTCEKKWYGKQNETRRYSSAYYRFYRLQPIHALFVPYSLKRNEMTFYQSDEIQDGTLLIDRRRIIENLSDTDFFDQLDSKKIVEHCLGLFEDLV